MKFEVRRNDKIVMQTSQDSCVPNKEFRDRLRKSGYKLYKDGKIFKG